MSSWSISAIDMLIERLSNIESKLDTQTVSLPDNICPCWISKVTFHENGSIQDITFNQYAKTSCKTCYPGGFYRNDS
jgi:hypothetical protein